MDAERDEIGHAFEADGDGVSADVSDDTHERAPGSAWRAGVNQIYANPEKWRIGREFLSRYTGTDPEAFQKQIILTKCRFPERTTAFWTLSRWRHATLKNEKHHIDVEGA